MEPESSRVVKLTATVTVEMADGSTSTLDLTLPGGSADSCSTEPEAVFSTANEYDGGDWYASAPSRLIWTDVMLTISGRVAAEFGEFARIVKSNGEGA